MKFRLRLMVQIMLIQVVESFSTAPKMEHVLELFKALSEKALSVLIQLVTVQ